MLAKSKCTWYWESIKSKRNASIVIRLTIFIFLIFGTILPILAGLGSPVSISVDGGAAQEFIGSSWVMQDLNAGQHAISVQPTGGPPQVIQKIFDVPPGGVARLEITLP